MTTSPKVRPTAITDRSVGFLLARAHRSLRGRLDVALAGSALHMGHVVLLACLHAQNDLTQTDLARMSGIEKSSVVIFLDALEAAAWIERRVPPADRRARTVHLTTAGRTRFAKLGRKLQAAEKQALAVFNVAERTQLNALLVRLIGHLDSDR